MLEQEKEAAADEQEQVPPQQPNTKTNNKRLIKSTKKPGVRDGNTATHAKAPKSATQAKAPNAATRSSPAKSDEVEGINTELNNLKVRSYSQG